MQVLAAHDGGIILARKSSNFHFESNESVMLLYKLNIARRQNETKTRGCTVQVNIWSRTNLYSIFLFYFLKWFLMVAAFVLWRPSYKKRVFVKYLVIISPGSKVFWEDWLGVRSVLLSCHKGSFLMFVTSKMATNLFPGLQKTDEDDFSCAREHFVTVGCALKDEVSHPLMADCRTSPASV